MYEYSSNHLALTNVFQHHHLAFLQTPALGQTNLVPVLLLISLVVLEEVWKLQVIHGVSLVALEVQLVVPHLVLLGVTLVVVVEVAMEIVVVFHQP